jgi:hypothetical protein
MILVGRHSFIALVALALAAPISAGCGDDTGGTGGAASTADVIFEAEATDEALEALLAATDVDDPTQAARLVAPSAGATLDASTPAKFSWTVGASASLLPARERSVATTAWAELAALLGPVRSAHAHGTPVNGRGYLLVIEDAEGTTAQRVFTLAFDHTPSASAWEKLAAAPQPLRASVRSAIFENNRIATDGGPWSGPSTEFTIAP